MALLWILSGCSSTAGSGESLIPAETPMVGTPPVAQTAVDPRYTPTATTPPSTNTIEFRSYEGYLRNPLMGWQDSRLEGEILPETVAYNRFNWSDLNPARGEYDWSPIETLRSFKTIAGKLISFRIRTSRPAPFGPGPVIPVWVANLGAQMYYEGGSGPEPLYHDCLYLDTHAEFVNALRERFDGDPDLAFIDIGSYGSYGEWDSDQYSEESGSLDWHARRRIADMYIGGSGVRPCLDPAGEILEIEYRYPGFQRTQLIMPFTPWFEDSLFYVLAKREDVGIRQDSLGSETHQQFIRERSAALIKDRWPKAPIVFEFAPSAYTGPALESAREFAREMHVTFIHDNFDGRGDLKEIREVLASIGYRLYLAQATYRDVLTVSDLLTIQTEWQNLGVAPPYFDAEIAFALQDRKGELVNIHRTGLELRAWLPGRPIVLDFQIPLSRELPAGHYLLKLAIVDKASLQFIQLAIDGQADQGYYSLGSLEITP